MARAKTTLYKPLRPGGVGFFFFHPGDRPQVAKASTVLGGKQRERKKKGKKIPWCVKPCVTRQLDLMAPLFGVKGWKQPH